MKTNTFLALLLAAVVTWGCGSDTSSTPAATPSAQKTGTVTFSVKFPAAGPSKAFIDANTAKVVINGSSFNGGWYLNPPVELTPANPTATVEVAEGQVCFNAEAYDSSVNASPFDRAQNCGEVVAGIANKATLTFLGGDWEFVDAGNIATPLTLQSATHGARALAGFRLSGYSYAGPARAGIDYTKPSGWSDYGLQFYSGTTTNAAKFGPTGFGGSESQFTPGTTASSNYSAFWSSAANLDVPANSGSTDLIYNWHAGERIAFILDQVTGGDGTETITGSTGQNFLPTLQANADSQIADASTITGHFLEMTMGPTPTKTVKTADVDCTLYWQQQGVPARVAAISKALAASGNNASKASPGQAVTLDSGTITNSYDSCETTGMTNIGTLYTYTETYSNVIAREFRAKAKQKGTSFILPATTISVSASYIEYRTQENPAQNHYAGWIEYRDNLTNPPTLIDAIDLDGVKLFDPSGLQLYLNSPPYFQKVNYLTANWDTATSTFGTAAAGGFSGYYLDLSSFSALDFGTYTFKTSLAVGQLLQTTTNFNSRIELPVVASSSMNSNWNADKSLTLSWTAPTGTFGGYRIVLLKNLNNTATPVFIAKATPSATSITLSETLLGQILLASGTTTATPFSWTVQTRTYDAANVVELARGSSNSLPIVPPGSGTGIIVR